MPNSSTVPENNFKPVPHGWPVPIKLFTRAVETMREYSRIGPEWVDAGRPKEGKLYEQFCAVEIEYNKCADQIWFGAWTPEQRQYWEDVYNRNA